MGAKISAKLRQQIASYIEKHYIDTDERMAYPSAVYQSRPTCASMERAEACKELCMSVLSLEDILEQADAGFTETLLHRIDQTGKKDSEIYKKANISKQHFSKIRNNPQYKPTKATALALAIALELDLDQTRDLIGRAGFALTNSSKADLIIRYFIENRNYNITEINIALYEFDQPLLGA